MEFDDLFTPIDTIRFDASVPLGTLGSVDLSDEGEFLVMDFPVGPVHVFTASGRHVRTTDISQCSSNDSGILWSARFLKNGGVVVVTSLGVYLLNADGSCNQRLSRIPPSFPSFCERQDTVYFMNHKRRWSPQIHAYSLESGNVRNYNLRKPRFPLSTAAEWGNTGHQIVCFDRGIFYRYAESSDGEPLWPRSDPVLFQPMSYRPPERDATARRRSIFRSQLEELVREFTYSDGIYGLDQNHRMITFEEPAEVNMIIVNMDTETGISTKDLRGLNIELTKNGLMYTFGDYELLPSGERGNRTLVVWRFQPF